MSERETYVLHLSDLHFGDPASTDADIKTHILNRHEFPTFQKHLEDFLVQLNKRFNYVLVTGDLVSAGAVSEFTKFNEFVTRLQAQAVFPDNECILIVPGNHDVTWPPAPLGNLSPSERYRGFVDIVGMRFRHSWLSDVYKPKYSKVITDSDHLPVQAKNCYLFDKDAGLFIYALNTSKGSGVREQLPAEIASHLPDPSTYSPEKAKQIHMFTLWDSGFAGYKALYELAALCDTLRADDLTREPFHRSLKICIFHHPLFAAPGEQTEVKRGHFLLDAGQVQRYLVQYGFHLVLHGHKHQESQASLVDVDGKALRTLGCGTIGGSGDRSFNILRWHDDILERRTITINDLPGNAMDIFNKNSWLSVWEQPISVYKDTTLTVIRARNVNEAYEKLARLFRSGADSSAARERLGTVQNLVVSIDSVFEGTFPASFNKSEDASRIQDVAKELFTPSPSSVFYSHAERQYAWHCSEPSNSGVTEDAVEAVIKELGNPESRRAVIVVGRDIERMKGAHEVVKKTYPRTALMTIQFRLHGGELKTTVSYRAQELSIFFLINALEIKDLIGQIAMKLRLSPSNYGQVTMMSGVAYWQESFVLPKKCKLDTIPQEILSPLVKCIVTCTDGYENKTRELLAGLDEKINHVSKYEFFDPKVVIDLKHICSQFEDTWVSSPEERNRVKLLQQKLEIFESLMMELLMTKASRMSERQVDEKLALLRSCLDELRRGLISE